MKVVIGIVVVVVIAALVVGCAPSVTMSTDSDTQTQNYEAKDAYEVLNTYTVELTAGYYGLGTHIETYFDPIPKACVEVRNTGSIPRLFSVYISFSEEYSGRDLLYLEPGESGIASYTVFREKAMSRKDYLDKIADWDYEVTPVVLGQNPENK